MNWDRYLIVVHAGSSGPHRLDVDDELGDDGKRAVVELALEVHVDLHCVRCDVDLAALEPDDINLDDVISVAEAHETECDPRSCQICGCTDAYACEGGCQWSERNPEMCTRCEAQLDAIVDKHAAAADG